MPGSQAGAGHAPHNPICGCLLAAGFILAFTPARAADLAPWRSKVTAFAAENFKHPAWGFSHSQRDYALARKLAAADHVMLDDDVLFAASYLHDMAAFAQWREAARSMAMLRR